MVFKLTNAQLTSLKSYASSNDSLPAAYKFLTRTAAGTDANQATLRFFEGAADVNAQNGKYAEFITNYTIAQKSIREGIILTKEDIRNVSNEIAKSIFSDIRDVLHKDPTVSDIPTVDRVAQQDAGRVAKNFFNGDKAGWAGTSMFLFLGHDADFRGSILEKPGDTYDLLAMLEAGKSASGTIGGFLNAVSLLWNAITTTTIKISGATSVISNAATLAQNFMTSAYGTSTALPQTLASNIYLGKLAKADSLTGSANADFVHGGGGNDTIGYSAGSDVLDGGTGTDTLNYAGRTGAMNITIKTLPTTATYIGSINQGLEVDVMFNIEKIVAGNGNDNFNINAIPTTTSVLTLDAGGGAGDTLSAFLLGKATTFDAVAGKLTAGTQTMNFSNFERFEGTNLNDIFYVNAKTTYVSGRDGIDTVDFSKLTSKPSTITLLGIENIKGTAYADKFLGSDSDTTNSTIYGGAGNDYIEGGGGNDKIYGEAGRNTLYGGEGNDLLSSDTGKDNWFYGGGGNDTIFVNIGAASVSDGLGDDSINVIAERGDINVDYYPIYDVTVAGGNDTVNIDFLPVIDPEYPAFVQDVWIRMTENTGNDTLIVNDLIAAGTYDKVDEVDYPLWVLYTGGTFLAVMDVTDRFSAWDVDNVYQVYSDYYKWTVNMFNFHNGDFGINLA